MVNWKRMYPVLIASTLGIAAIGTNVIPALKANASSTAAMVNGTIFNDKNGDGQRNENEPGIANVVVSDGVSVAVTKEDGTYLLPVDTDAYLKPMVMISTPSGYAAPSNNFYKSIPLVSGEQKTVDFALVNKPESNNENFSFVNVADVHVQSETDRDRFKWQMEQINKVSGDPAFVAVAGDLTDYATEAEYQRYKEVTTFSKVPVVAAIGNHDFTSGPDYKTRVQRFRDYIGPQYFSFNYGQKHFVLLDNIQGFAQPMQLEWLKADLAQVEKDTEIVVMTHRPLAHPQSATESPQYIELLSKYNVKLVLIGHTHVNDVQTDVIPNAKHVVTNSSKYTIDQTPWGFRMVNFHGDEEVQVPFKMYGVEKSLTLVNPANGAKIAKNDTTLLANSYNTTSNVVSVEYSIDGGEWYKMHAAGAFSWYADWNASKAVIGPHTITVRAADDKGEQWEKQSSFEIVASTEQPELGSNWNTFMGGTTHNGVAADTIKPNLGMTWSFKSNASILTSSPAVVDDVAYVGVKDENDTDLNGVVAVDAKTGKQLWKFKTEGQVQASPAVQDGIVYAPSIHGVIYAIDAKTGQQVWQKNVAEDFRRGWIYASPTVSGSKVYLPYTTGKGNYALAIDSKTGTELWKVKIASTWMVHTSPAVADGKVYFGSQSGSVHAFDAETGVQKWTNRLGGGWMNSSLTAANGMVYIGYQGNNLAAYNAETGAKAWTYKSQDTSYIPQATSGATAAVKGDTLYMGFPDGNFTAFNALTGEKKWSYRTGGGIISSAAISGDTVYVGSNDGFLYAFNASTGENVWKYEIGAWVASSPAISGNSLYVGAYDGNLYSFTEQK